MIGQLEHHAIEHVAHRPRAFLEVERRRNTAPPTIIAIHQPCSCTNRDMSMTMRVNAGRSAPKPLNSASNCGITNSSRISVTIDRDREHRGRVEQRLLDLLLERLGLFLVGRDLVQQRLERARLLAGLDQVHVQVVEIERVLGEGLVQRTAALDVQLDVEDQLLHRRLFMADADDLEGLHQRDARRQHGRELAAEHRDVHRADPAAGAEEPAAAS